MVPENAVGKRVRCPGCRGVFVVPKEEDVLDETFADMLRGEDEDDDDLPMPGETKPAAGSSSAKSGGVATAPAAGGESGKSAAESAPVAAAASTTGRTGSTQDAIRSHNLKLVVVDVSTAGVKLAFSAAWLGHLPFRASMPFHCVLCGEASAEKLIARPLAWLDKATGHFANVAEIEARYEYHVRAHQTPREVVQAMRPIDELPPPFLNTMPYYVCRSCAPQVMVNCQSVATEEGVACEVTIPNGDYALQWLGRVNGVCGDDYAALESVVLKMSESTWRDVPEETRKRLSAWFDFKAGEDFLAYFNDGDFPAADAGLAGLVVTDGRIVFCKYHHHGEIPLTSPGPLLGVKVDRFVEIKLVQNGKLKKTSVRLRSDDAAELGGLLKRLNTPLQMEVG